jgi:hypothetical protein
MSSQTYPVKGKKQGVTVVSVIWPWVAIAGVIIAAAVIRYHLLSIPFERDEGEYAYIAQQMLKGVPPYVSAYSMKLPGIYFVYAMIMSVFGQTHTAVHLGLLICNAATIFIVFLLTRKLVSSLAGVVAGCAYAILSLTHQVTGLWANAEHFVLLPAFLGLMLIYNYGNKNKYFWLFTAGLLLGFAFIIKQHGIFFVLLGALYLLYSGLRQRPILWINTIVTQIVFAAGAIIPFSIVCFLFWRNGTFDKFWYWTFTYAREYATSLTLSEGQDCFVRQIWRIIKDAPIIWGLAAGGLSAFILIRQYRQWAVFIIGLLLFSFLAVCPGFYFRGHYFIFILPSVAIFAGIALATIDGLFQKIMPVFLRVIMTAAIGLGVAGYSLYTMRGYIFYLSPEDVCRKVYGANPFPESLRIAEFIRNNSDANDTVAVIGSEPQIYFYSGRRSATSYIYTYPLMEPTKAAGKMQQEMITQIETAKPAFLVLVRVSTSWIVQPGSKQDIFKWVDPYINNFYNMVGVIDIPSSGQANYYWNSQVENRIPESNFWVMVFKRRE